MAHGASGRIPVCEERQHVLEEVLVVALKQGKRGAGVLDRIFNFLLPQEFYELLDAEMKECIFHLLIPSALPNKQLPHSLHVPLENHVPNFLPILQPKQARLLVRLGLLIETLFVERFERVRITVVHQVRANNVVACACRNSTLQNRKLPLLPLLSNHPFDVELERLCTKVDLDSLILRMQTNCWVKRRFHVLEGNPELLPVLRKEYFPVL
mmetsp:Transcript_4892/g.8693  ORF Transcript_4892/g.8693 Transcript_4892/m.8693 type:complete len:211 (-) Transcript_4892:344-976(-)